MKVKNEREVAQLCPTLRNPMGFSLPGSSVHGIFQARVLEWGAIAFSAPSLNVDKKIKLWWRKVGVELPGAAFQIILKTGL